MAILCWAAKNSLRGTIIIIISISIIILLLLLLFSFSYFSPTYLPNLLLLLPHTVSNVRDTPLCSAVYNYTVHTCFPTAKKKELKK
jgi:hypothetical protein